MTRVVVVDDHPVFRKGLVALLRASEVEVVGEAASGTEAIEVVRDVAPDLVLMDLGLPDASGIAATEQIVAESPEIRVVVITLYDDEQSVRAAFEAGATAYVLKQSPPEQIIAAMDAAMSGALWVGAGVPRPGFGHADGGPGRVPGPHAPRGGDRRPHEPRPRKPRDRRAPRPLTQDRRELRVAHPREARRRGSARRRPHGPLAPRATRVTEGFAHCAPN